MLGTTQCRSKTLQHGGCRPRKRGGRSQSTGTGPRCPGAEFHRAPVLISGSAVELARESGAGPAIEERKASSQRLYRRQYRLAWAARGLEKSVVRGLAKESQWVQNHENLFVLGPTGVGKSYIACALAQKACRDGYSAFYTRAAALFRDLALARADGSFRNLLARLSRIDVLVIDDWAMAPLLEPERYRDFWEICEDRYQVRSLILTSQLPVARWHEQIGDPTVADGILDRLVHNAHLH